MITTRLYAVWINTNHFQMNQEHHDLTIISSAFYCLQQKAADIATLNLIGHQIPRLVKVPGSEQGLGINQTFWVLLDPLLHSFIQVQACPELRTRATAKLIKVIHDIYSTLRLL